MLCAGTGKAGPFSVALNFLDGSPDALRELTCHLLAVTGKTVVEAMVPGSSGDTLAALRALGFSAEYDGEADVYVYDRELAAGDVS